MITLTFEYLVLGFGAVLVLIGIFIIPRKNDPLVQPGGKSKLAEFSDFHKKYSLEHQPLSRLGLLTWVSIIGAMFFSGVELAWYSYGLYALGIAFLAADIYNRVKNRNSPRRNWRPFLGLLLPAMVLLIGEFATIENPQLSYSFAAAAIACAVIDIYYKLKK